MGLGKEERACTGLAWGAPLSIARFRADSPVVCCADLSLRLTPHACALLVFAALTAPSQSAQGRTPVRLEWVRGSGAGECPSAAVLEAQVKRRLGWACFDDAATARLEGLLDRQGKQWVASLWFDPGEATERPAPRVIRSDAESCASLGEAVVLAVALVIDPANAFREPAPEAPPKPPATPPPAVPPAPPAVAVPEARRRVDGIGSVRSVLDFGIAPRTSWGAELALGLGTRWRSELSLLALAARNDRAREAQYSFAGAALALCPGLFVGTSWDLRACGRLTAGEVQTSLLSGERTQPGSRLSAFGQLGLRGSARLTSALWLDLEAAATSPLVKYRFYLEGTERTLYQQPSIWLVSRLGLSLHFE